MRKGTFSVQTANPNSAKHNSRELAPKYLIDSSQKNYYELLKKDDDFILEAQAIYKDKIKQTMQKKQVENLIQETVLTLQPNQDEKDVKDLFKKLNQKYGGHELLEVAIHRDEGYFLKDDIAYYPTKNILNKNGDWYVCSDNSIKKPKQDDFDRIVNINEFEKVYNYHAHAKFSMFDRETGKTARMQKKDMSERIKFVSDELGLLFAPDQETSRIKKSVNLVKDEHLARARELETQKELKQELAKAKDLQEINKQLREELKEMGALRADYAQLEALNKELKEQVKNKTLTIEELNNIINEYKQDKAPKTNESILNDKSIEKQEKEVLGSLKDDFQSELEANKKGLLGKSYEVKLKEEFSHSPNVESLTLFMRVKKKLTNAYDIIKAQAIKILNLETENKSLKKENDKLSRELREAELEIKELSKDKSELSPLNSEKKETALDKLVTNYEKSKLEINKPIPKDKTLEEILKSPVKKEDLKEAQDNLKELIANSKSNQIHMNK